MGLALFSGPLREAFVALRRELERGSLAPNTPAKRAPQLDAALANLHEVFESEESVALEVNATSLLCNGLVVHTERARESGICMRLYRDGVRSLTFRRGLSHDELLAFCKVAFHDPRQEADSGREDAVTELWKADLSNISYSALDAYRMERGEFDGGRVAALVAGIRARAQPELLAPNEPRPASKPGTTSAGSAPLVSREKLAELDPQHWPALAQRSAIALLRIVEQGLAGRDLHALEESFLLLLGELNARDELALAGRALEMVRAMGGQHALRFRATVGKRLAQPAMLARIIQQAAATERILAQTLPPWLALLPRELGPVLLDMLGNAPAAVQPLLARAAVERVGLSADRLATVLAKGPPGQVLAMLAAFDSLPPAKRAGLAALALQHTSARVRIEAAAVVTCKPELGVRPLGKMLHAAESSVRTAAARALASCASVAELAGELLIEAMSKAQFQRRTHEEQLLFHRALGRLGSSIGFEFLVARLTERRGLFRRKPSAKTRLMAISGIEEESSARAMRALDIVSAVGSRQSAPVAEAAHAAALRIRLADRNPGSRG